MDGTPIETREGGCGDEIDVGDATVLQYPLRP